MDTLVNLVTQCHPRSLKIALMGWVFIAHLEIEHRTL